MLCWRSDRFFRLNTERNADPDTLYNVLVQWTGWPGFDPGLQQGQPPTVLNTVSSVLFLACCAGIAYVALSAPTRPRLAQLGFLVVAAFLLTNKVWSPQYSLWLVPLAVLALPRWKPLLAMITGVERRTRSEHVTSCPTRLRSPCAPVGRRGPGAA